MDTTMAYVGRLYSGSFMDLSEEQTWLTGEEISIFAHRSYILVRGMNSKVPTFNMTTLHMNT